MTGTKRYIALGVFLPVAFAGATALGFLYRINLGNRIQNSVKLPHASAPNRDSSIIVFAPHCDDESLGCAGLIQLAAKAGAQVKVVAMSNGDGFRVAADLQYHEVRIRPQDYVRFAELRQKETTKAVELLGLSKDDLIFLGYPDRGLMQMWTTNWSPSQPFRSYYTKCDHSPYPLCYHRDAAYCGRNVFDDIRSILAKYKPTDIYVTHPSDDHPDHAAAYSFVTSALYSLVDSGNSDLEKTKVHTYLIHRGEWPIPMAYRPKASLAPPFALARLDTTWDSLPLSPNAVRTKRNAIMCHRSQTAVMREFLMSFARKNELFGDVQTPRIPRVRDGQVRLDGETAEWAGVAPAEMDPVADKLVQGIEKAGDIKSVYTCADSGNVYIRVDFKRNLSKRVAYRVGLRSFAQTDNGEDSKCWIATVRPPNRCDPPGTYFAWKGSSLEIMAPRSELGSADRLFVGVNASAMRLKIDSAGWRGFKLGNE